MTRLRRLGVGAVLFAVLTPGAAAQQQTPESIKGIRSWVGPAALQLIPAAPRLRLPIQALPVPDAQAPGARPATQQLRPRVLSASASSPAIGFSQEGINSVQAGQSDPADVAIAVGRSYLGETVNTAVGWWRIGAGFSTATIRQLGDFFSTSSTDRHPDFMSDPRILYDAPTDRWFFVAFDVTRAETDLAVSTSGDPTQAWFIYAFPAAGCPDQPRLAVSDAMVAISYDLFASCASRIPPYVGGVVRLLDKNALLAGQAPASGIFGPDARFSGITPVALLSGGSTIFLVSTDYVFSQVIVYTATSVAQPSIPIRRVSVRALYRAPPPLQLGSSVPVDPGDNRVQDAFLLGGNIWLAADDGCAPGGVFSACIRYTELTPSGQVLDEREEALAQGRSAMYPAFRPDAAGNLFSIFGFSSASDYASLGVDLDPGHLSGYLVLKSGTGANTSGRWGDYFSAAYDPSDATRVWVAGAYGTTNGWGTFIAAVGAAPFTIANPTPPAPPKPTDTSAPIVRAVASAGRLGSTIRLFYRLSDDSRQSREVVTVRRQDTVIATIRTRSAPIENGTLYHVSWSAPSRLRPGQLSFCVVSYDAAENQSAQSCAAITLKR